MIVQPRFNRREARSPGTLMAAGYTFTNVLANHTIDVQFAPDLVGDAALAFDGISRHVTFGAAPELGASSFTVEVWFKKTGTGATTSTGSGGVTAVPLIAKGR